MKKIFFVARRWCACTLLVLACAVFVAGCEEDLPEDTHNDTTFLKGDWENTAKGTQFTIRDDLSFTCDIFVDQAGKANVTGRLDPAKSGPNDYVLRQMTTAGDPTTYPASAGIKPQVQGFSNQLIATLTPSPDKKKFTFASNMPAADLFFGGEFTKQESE
jgi:hypothetical protein